MDMCSRSFIGKGKKNERSMHGWGKNKTKKKGRETAQQKTSGMLRSSSYIPYMYVFLN